MTNVNVTALVTGKLLERPERRVGPSGRPFVRVRVSVPSEEGAQGMLVTAFAPTVCDVLMVLDAGARVALGGSLRLGIWHPTDGSPPRLNMSLTADSIMTTHERRRVDKAVARARQRPEPHEDPHRSRIETAALWGPRTAPGASGFDDLPDDVP